MTSSTSIKTWIKKRLANTDLVMLIISIIIIALLLMFTAKYMMPVLVSLIFAYLLDGLVNRLERWKVPRALATSLVCLLFVSLLILSLFVLLPLLWEQLANLFAEIPTLIKKLEAIFLDLTQRYSDYVSPVKIKNFLTSSQNEFGNLGKLAVSYSVATVFNVMTLLVYLVLVPLMVFFFLKDKRQILQWFKNFLPERRKLIIKVWAEVNQQMVNYIQAKVLEMIIVSVMSTLVFAFLGLNYSVLLGVLVGLSSLIPYIGIVVVTIPVLVIGYLQWGFSPHFLYLVIVYAILTTVDGNVLAPLLFSERLKIHPVAVIIAVFVFGGLWGFWGVFFAIPLATVVKAVLNAWFNSEPTLAE